MFQLARAADALLHTILTIEGDDTLTAGEKQTNLDVLYRDLATLRSRLREMKRAA